MGLRSYSAFGYGVVVENVKGDKSKGSPMELALSSEADDSGICVVPIGTNDCSMLLICVEEALSTSDCWEPKLIPPRAMAVLEGWDRRVLDYVDRWSLRDNLSPGFSRPGFVHSPYYG